MPSDVIDCLQIRQAVDLMATNQIRLMSSNTSLASRPAASHGWTTRVIARMIIDQPSSRRHPTPSSQLRIDERRIDDHSMASRPTVHR